MTEKYHFRAILSLLILIFVWWQFAGYEVVITVCAAILLALNLKVHKCPVEAPATKPIKKNVKKKK